MSVEWIVYSYYQPPYRDKPVVVQDHFDDEDSVSAFCHEAPEDIIEVLVLKRRPLGVDDVTELFVPSAAPSLYDREADRGDRAYEQAKEFV